MSNQLEHTGDYRIKTVATMTGLSTHLIRKWEERYHLIHPQRGTNGYRTFTEEDIQVLLYLKSQLRHGETIGQLAKKGKKYLVQTMRDISLSCSSFPNQFKEEARKVIHYAQEQDYAGIQQTIVKGILTLRLEEAMEAFLLPLLRFLGELWGQGRISISAENSVRRIVRQQIINALKKDFSAGQEQALIACVPGENREIAPLTATLLLQKGGWQATYLGPEVSLEVLQIAVRRREADLMILYSATKPNFQIGRSWMETMAHSFQPDCQVIALGEGFHAFSELLDQYRIPYLRKVKELMPLFRFNPSWTNEGGIEGYERAKEYRPL